MNFNDFDWMEDDLDLVPTVTTGWDTENEQRVTFIEWSDEDNQDMCIVEADNGDRYETYPEEITWDA